MICAGASALRKKSGTIEIDELMSGVAVNVDQFDWKDQKLLIMISSHPGASV